jgi:phasin family protein
MADQAATTKINEAKAETLPAADALRAPVAVAAAAPKAISAEPAKAAPAAPAKAAVPARAEAKPARKPRKVRKTAKKPAAARTIKAKAKAKPARPTAKARIITRPARAGIDAIKTGAKTMNTQTRKAAEAAQTAADQIKTVFGDVNARAKTAMEKNAKIAEELAELARGNVEAMVASSKLAAKGVESMSQDAATYSRKSFEDASAAFKSFANVKSATDFFKLQGDFARSAFDSAVAESARVSETVLKLAGDVAEPLTSRYAVTAERVKTLAA